MTHESPNPFSSAKLISVSTDPAVYLRTGADIKRGDSAFILSSGHLNAIATCPAKWRAGSEVEEKKSWQMNFGSLLDCLLLVPELKDKRFAVTPETFEAEGMECPRCGSVTESNSCRECKCERVKKNFTYPWSPVMGVCRAWVKEREAEGRIVVDRKTNEKVLHSLEVVKLHADLLSLIQNSDHQVFAMAEYHDKETGIVVTVKTMGDMVPHDDPMLPWSKCLFDLKSARNGNPYSWPSICWSEGYAVQLAIYSHVLSLALSRELSTAGHIIIENEAPFHVVEPWPMLDAEFMELARLRYVEALKTYCRCLKTNEWPSYPLMAGTLVSQGMQFMKPTTRMML